MINIVTLGKFEFYIDGRPVSFGKKISNSLKLFLLLINQREEGISKSELLYQIFRSQDTASDLSGNLRIVMYRLRKTLHELGVLCPADSDYILSHQSYYFWNPDVPVQTDADAFEAAFSSLSNSPSTELAPYLQALDLYTGEYLPFFNTEEWVITRQIRLNRDYDTLFLHAFKSLMEQGKYQNAYDIAARASALYPFNEYQANMIEGLLSMNSYEKAFQLYTETADLYFREMGLEPPQKMRDLLERMNHPVQYSGIALEQVRTILGEEDNTGAFYCSMPSFIDNYRFVSRLIERTGQSAYILLTVLEDSGHIPLAPEDEKTMEAYSVLRNALHLVLRKGDIFTSYSGCTFLSLLMCTNDQGCKIVTKRIREKFKELNPPSRAHLSFHSFPVSCPEHNFSRLSSLSGNQELCVCIDRYDNLRIEGRVFNRFTDIPILFSNITDFFLKLNLLFDDIGFPQSDQKIKQTHKADPSLPFNQPVRKPQFSVKQIMENHGKVMTFCLKVSQRRHLSWQGIMEIAETDQTIPFNSELQLAYELFRFSDKKEKGDVR